MEKPEEQPAARGGGRSVDGARSTATPLPNYRLQLNALDGGREGGREGWMAVGNRRYIAWPATEVVKFHTI